DRGDVRGAGRLEAWRCAPGERGHPGGHARGLPAAAPNDGTLGWRGARDGAPCGGRHPRRGTVLPMIVCRTLGPLEVTVDGTVASGDLLWRKPLALLIYLARSGRRGRAREHLSAMFWSEKPDADARHSLNEALRILRHHAGKDAVETAAGQVRLLPDAVRLDVDDLEALASRQDWPAAAALVSGEFLEGFGLPEASGFEDWLAAERDL